MTRIFKLCGVALLFAVRAHAAEVCNAGFPGENSAQILQRLPAALANCSHPDTVVVFVGMNDAANPARFLVPEETQANVVRVLDAVRAAHARAVLVTAHMPDLTRLMQRHPASDYGDRSPQKRIEDVDAALQDAARREHATIADFATALAQAGGANAALSTDGVHLTVEGYHLLASTVAKALPKDATKVLCLGDSLTYGIGVRVPGAPDAGIASYPQQLQGLLSGSL